MSHLNGLYRTKVFSEAILAAKPTLIEVSRSRVWNVSKSLTKWVIGLGGSLFCSDGSSCNGARLAGTTWLLVTSAGQDCKALRTRVRQGSSTSLQLQQRLAHSNREAEAKLGVVPFFGVQELSRLVTHCIDRKWSYCVNALAQIQQSCLVVKYLLNERAFCVYERFTLWQRICVIRR